MVFLIKSLRCKTGTTCVLAMVAHQACVYSARGWLQDLMHHDNIVLEMISDMQTGSAESVDMMHTAPSCVQRDNVKRSRVHEAMYNTRAPPYKVRAHSQVLPRRGKAHLCARRCAGPRVLFVRDSRLCSCAGTLSGVLRVTFPHGLNQWARHFKRSVPERMVCNQPASVLHGYKHPTNSMRSACRLS